MRRLKIAFRSWRDGVVGYSQKSSGRVSKNISENLNAVMSNRPKHLYDFDRFRLESERQRLLREGEPIALPPKAVELLLVLVEHQGRILEKDFLMNSLWGNTAVEESNLTQNIYLLRKALGKTADGQSFIETH